MYDTETNLNISDEENLINWYKKIGYSLLLGFIFPIYFSSPFGSKLLFPNISLLGKGLMADISLLYPLIAGVLVLIIVKTQDGLKRGIAMLSIILLPLLIMHILKKDIVSSIARGSFNATLIIQLLILSIIGMFIGAKTIIKFDTQAGRLIGGISSITFLILLLLPVELKTPVFFSLFKLIKLPGQMKFIVIVLIIASLILIYSALMGIINFKWNKNTLIMAEKTKKMIIISVLAVLAVFLFMTFFSSQNTSFTIVIKIFLLIGGFIALIAESLWDIVESSQPVTIKGGDFMNTSY